MFSVVVIEDNPEELGQTNEDIDMSIEKINKVPAHHKKRIPTKNGIINSIEKALALKNYNPVEPTDQKKDICGVMKDRNDTRTIAFVNKPPNATRIPRKKTHNVLSSNRELQKQQKILKQN